MSNVFSSSSQLLPWLVLAEKRHCLDPPASGTSRLVTTALLLRTRLSPFTPVDISPHQSPTVSSSVPITQKSIINTRSKHYQENWARSKLTFTLEVS